MVAVVSGNDFGLFNTSLGKLGNSFGGQPGVGAGNLADYVNLATGNLILQNQQDSLVGQGLPIAFLQTYNSQGQMSQTGWLSNLDSSVSLVSGALGATGSTVRRLDGDGATTLFTYDNNPNDSNYGKYVSQDGSGADDTLSYDAGSGQLTWTEGSTRQQMVYDSTGRLIQVDDAESGASFTLSYGGATDLSGRDLLTGITSADGESLVLGYNSVGQLTTLGTQSGNVTTNQVSYGYDSSGRLTSVSTDLTPGDDSSVFTTAYTYEGDSLRIASVSQYDGAYAMTPPSNDVLVSFTYDSSGRVQTVTQGDAADHSAQTTSFTYNSNETDVTDPLGRVTSYVYDSAGRISQVQSPAINGLRATTTYAYDPASGKLACVTDANGNVTTYGYDANGNLIYQQDPTGSTVTRTYNSDDQLLTQTVYTAMAATGATPVSGGETTRYVYDSNDRLVYTIDATGDVTQNQYSEGLLASTHIFLSATYDTSSLANDEAPTETQMDSWAGSQDLTQTTLTTYGYDMRGQLDAKNVYDAVDASGNGILDAGTELTQYTYDAQGLLRQSVNLTGSDHSTQEVTSYVYDGLGRLLSSTDALHNVTTRAYDDTDHSLTVTSANGLITTQLRNAAGELLNVAQGSVGDPTDQSTRYYYDAAGELTAVQDADGGLSYSFYDADGRISATVDATGAVTRYAYDADGNCTSTTQYANRVNTSGWLNTTSGQVTGSLTLPTASSDDRTTQYFYDTAGREVGSTDADGYFTQTMYDGAGQVVESLAYANKINASAPALYTSGPLSGVHLAPDAANDRITRYFYDTDGREVGSLDAAGYLTQTRYDAAGRITSTTSYANQVTDATALATGSLSALAALATGGANADSTTRYFYDAAGNEIGAISAEGYLTTTAYSQVQHSTTTTYYLASLQGLSGNESLSALLSREVSGGSATETSSCIYDALGRKSVETDRYGTVIRYAYDTMGNLTATYAVDNTSDVRDDFKRYDLFGNLIGEMTGQAAADALASLGSGQTLDTLSDIQLDAAYSQYGTTYTYNNLNQKTKTTDAQGNSTYYLYDADGRQTHAINALGEVSETLYDAFGQVAETVQYSGTIATDPTTLSNLQTAIRVALSGQSDGTQYAFVNVTGSNDAITSYTYDRRGNVSQKTDALNQKTGYSYDAFSELTQLSAPITSSSSVLSQYVYDRRGLKTSTIQDLGGADETTSSAQYDAFGRVTQTTDGNGNIVTYSYTDQNGVDQHGRIVTTSQMVGRVARSTQITYDAFSRVLSQIDALGNPTTYVYNDASHAVFVSSPEIYATTGKPITTTTVYDGFGDVTEAVDGSGMPTIYYYNGSGQLTQTETNAGITHDVYNELGQLSSSTDANGTITAYTYDALGRILTRTVDSSTDTHTGLNLSTGYSYDDANRTVSVTDANGIVTQTAYDLDGRSVSVTVDPTGLDLVTTFTYDAQGRQLTVTEDPGQTDARSTQYVYDDLGRLSQMIVDPAGLAITTSYRYDAAGNMTSMTDADGNVTRYSYNEANQLVFTLSPIGTNGQGASATQVAATQQFYDADGRLTATVRYATAVTINPAQLDADSNQDTGAAAATNYLNGLVAAVADPTQDAAQYTVYDKDGRAIYSIDPAGTVTGTAYDGAGRVTEQHVYATPLTLTTTMRSALEAGEGETTFSAPAATSQDRRTLTIYDNTGRARYVVQTATVEGVATATVLRQEYDAVGNLVQSTSLANTTTYSNTLTQTALDSQYAQPATGDATTLYAYDAANRLVYTFDPTGAATQNVYDGNGNVVEKRAFVATVDTSNVDDLISARQAVAGLAAYDTSYQYDDAGRLLQTTDALGNSESYQYDATGLKTSYTDKNGNVTNYSYDKAGRLTQQTAPAAAVGYVNSNGAYYQTTAALVTHISYDGMGNVLTHTQGYGLVLGGVDQSVTTKYSYDAAGHQINTINQISGYYDYNSASFTGKTTSVSVSYDVLGRAYAENDANGNWSYKAYDQAGRVLYDVDGNNGVTGYAYDAFGDQISTTRYYNPLKLSDWTPGAEVTAAYIGQTQHLASSPNDRTLTTTYDAAGRKLSVTQSSVGSNVALSSNPLSYNSASNPSPVALGDDYAASPTTTYQYDAHGDLIEESVLVTAQPGQSQKWANTFHYYDAAGRKVMDVDADGYVTTWAFDAQGNVLNTTQYAQAIGTGNLNPLVMPEPPAAPTVDTGEDRITYYAYDALGHVLQETMPVNYETASGSPRFGNLVTTMTYDKDGNLLTTTVNGGTTTNSYDSLDRLVSTTGPAYSVLSTVSTAEGQTWPQLEVDAYYLEKGLGTSSIYTTNSSYTTYAYDLSGNQVKASRYVNGSADAGNPLAQTYDTDTGYDAAGHVITKKDATGNVTTYSYDGLGNVTNVSYKLDISSTQEVTVNQSYTYDGAGQQLTSVLKRGSFVESSVTNEYDSFGDITKTITTNDSQTDLSNQAYSYTHTYSYDNAGRLTGQDLGTDFAQQFWYDLAGSRLATMANGATTYSYRDALGRDLIVVQPTFTQSGSNTTPVITYSYDRWGNVTQQTDALGYVTNYSYNEQNELISEVQPMVAIVGSNGATTYARPEIDYYYDIQGRQIGMRDANGNNTKTYYDAAGHVTETVDGISNATLYAYDALGRQTVSEDPDGNVTFQTFDALDRLTDQGDLRPNSGSTGNYGLHFLQNYELNQNGNRIVSTDALGNVTHYTYDVRGDVLISKTPDGVTISYGYDALGNRVSYSDSAGQQQWVYNAQGKLAQHQDLSGMVHDYSYNSSGWLSRETLEEANSSPVKSYTYLQNGLLASISDPSDSSTYSYSYDANGNRVSEEDKTEDGNGTPVHTITTVEFDSHSRITQAVTQDVIANEYTLELQYGYDAQGNRRDISVRSSYGTNTLPISSSDVADQPPVAMGDFSNINIRTGDTYSFSTQASNIFQDPESDTIQYSAYIQNSDGSQTALNNSGWLTFTYDKLNQQLVFTAHSAQAGTYDIVLQATDGQGHTAQLSSFNLKVSSGHKPTVSAAFPKVVVNSGTSLDYELFAEDYFTAPYTGDTLTLSIDPATPLPDWLQVDARRDALHLTGVPSDLDLGSVQLNIIATDEAGNTTSSTLTLTVQPATALAPIATTPVPPQVATTAHSFSYSVAASDMFSYPEGDNPAFTVQLSNGNPLPSWLQVQDDSTSTDPVFSFSGTPPQSEANANYDIRITAVDGNSTGYVDMQLSVITEQAPVAQVSSLNVPAKVHTDFSQSWAISSLFVDPNGDPITLSVTPASGSSAANSGWTWRQGGGRAQSNSGSTLDWSWLQVTTDGNNLILSGEPPSNAYDGTFTFNVSANDGDLTTTIPLTLTINGDYPPVIGGVAIVPPSLIASTDTVAMPYSYTIPAGAITDPDGDPLTYQLYSIGSDGSQQPLSALGGWLSFDPNTRTISASAVPEIQNTAYPQYPLQLVVSDGTNTVTYNFTLTTAPFVDHAPVVNNVSHPSLLQVQNGQTLSYTTPTGLYTDQDNEALSYSAQIQPIGDDNWYDLSSVGLSIDPTTGNISGTANGFGNYILQVTATDPEGADATVGYTLEITTPPTSSPATTVQVGYNTSFSIDIGAQGGFSDPNGDAITYSLASGSTLPTGVHLSAAGVLSGDVTSISSHTLTIVGSVDGYTTGTVVTLNAVDSAPAYNGGFSNKTVYDGASFNFSFKDSSWNSQIFTDPNLSGNNPNLTYTAQQLVNGVATQLPTGLTFSQSYSYSNGNTYSFSGTLPTGIYTIQVTATDPQGMSTTAQFVLTSSSAAPTYNNGISDQVAQPGVAFSYPIPTADFVNPITAGTYSGALTYTVTGLPSWLTLNTTTMTLSGTPTKAGTYPVTVTVSNGSSDQTVVTFNVIVPNVAPTYTAGDIVDQTATAGTAFSYKFAAASFSDLNADTLTYNAYNLPAWLSFNPANRTFSGTPGAAGTTTITVIASDGQFTTATNFNITVADAAPVYTASSIVNQTVTGGQAFSYQLPLNAFTDPNGDALIYSLSGMPSWMQYDPISQTFTGVANVAAGIYTTTITATDGSGQSVSHNFKVTVSNVAPYVNSALLVAQSALPGQSFSYQIPANAFQDPNNDVLSYTVSGLPAWLSFNASTRTFSGTAPASGSWSVTITASDGNPTTPLTVSTTLGFSVANVAPTYNGGLGTFAVAPNQLTYAIPAGTFTDANGDALTYSVSGMPAWLGFTPGTGTFNVLNFAPAGTYPVTVTATDGNGLSVSATLTVSVPNVGPVYQSGKLVSQSAQAGLAYTYIVPNILTAGGYTFLDLNSGTLSYSASGMPSWLSFNASTLTFSGTPPAGTTGTSTVTLTATDPSGLSASGSFAITVPATPSPVSLTSNLAGWTIQPGTSPNYVIPTGIFTSSNGYTLSYSASGLPSWLQLGANNTFNAANAPYTPGSWTVTVTASDGHGNTAKDNLVITVPNVAPVYNNGLSSQTNITPGQYFSYNPIGTIFTDANRDTLTYSASGLPSWMTFDPSTMTFAGMPGTSGTWTVTLKATDASGLSATHSFTVSVSNVAPSHNGGNVNLTIQPNQVSTYVLPAGAFTDANGDTLTYSASNLPSWASINSSTGTVTFSNPPPGSSNQNISIKASDPNGLSSSNLSLNVTVASLPPTYDGSLVSQTPTAGQAFTYIFGWTTFTDPQGQTLNYSVTGMPSWLTFNSNQRKFSGTPPAGTAGSWYVTLTVQDQANTSTVAGFLISMSDSGPVYNSATGLTNQTAAASGNFNYTIPSNAFTDPNGDTLQYSVSGLPSWLSFNPATRVFSGTPASAGSATITVTAADPAGLSVSHSFTVTVPNVAPVYNSVLTNQTIAAGQTLNYSMSVNAFTDANGDPLIYSASGLPSWVTFNAATGNFSGTAPLASGSWAVTVTATDPSGLSASGSFSITVPNVAPVYASGGLANQDAIAGQSFSYAIPAGAFTDANADTLTYTATGLPSWLTFNAASGTFSGTAGAAGRSTITVTGTDPSGATATGTFVISVGYAAPVYVAGTLPDVTVLPGNSSSFSMPAGAFVDPNGGPLSYGVSGLPSWMTFNAQTMTFSGTAPWAYGSWAVTVTAMDPGGLTAVRSFNVIVPDATPTYNGSLSNQIVQPAAAFNFGVAGAFSDLKNDPLTFTQTGKPSWLSFNASTGTLSGTAQRASGSWTITVTATNPGGLATSATFTITVPEVAPVVTSNTQWNLAPTAGNSSHALTFSAPNSDGLTYTLSGAPAWLTYSNGSFIASSGEAAGTYYVTVTATNAGGLSSNAVQVISVANVPPVVKTKLTNQAPSLNSAYSYQIPANTFVDPNGGAITYQQPSGMPSWMSFNTSTGTFSGTTPTTGGVAWTITVVATDSTGLSVSTSFVVDPGYTPPVYTAPTNPIIVTIGDPAPVPLPFPINSPSNPGGLPLSLSVVSQTSSSGQVDSRDVVNYDSASGSLKTESGTFNQTNTTYSIKYQITDIFGNSSTVTVQYKTLPGPVYNGPPNWVVQPLQTSTFNIGSYFTDPNSGATLSYQITSGPSWLSVSGNNLIGAAPANGSWNVTINAVDSAGAHKVITLAVQVADVAPTYANGLGIWTVQPGVNSTFTMPFTTFTDINGNDLTYTAIGMPSWLSLTGGSGGSSRGATWRSKNDWTGSFTALAPTTPGTWYVTVIAKDPGGLTASGTLIITVPEAAPVYTGAAVDQYVPLNNQFSVNMPTASLFKSPNGNPLSIVVSSLPQGVSYNTTTKTLSGQIQTFGTYAVTVTARDQVSQLITTTTFNIITTDSAPVYSGGPGYPVQVAAVDRPYTWTLDPSWFTDANGEALTYSASLADGSPLPAGLSWDSVTNSIIGVPEDGTAGTYTVQITATDPEGKSGTAQFTLVVDTPPQVAFQAPDQVIAVGTQWNFTLANGSFDDPDGNAMTYQVSGLPAGTTFNRQTLAFGGTANTAGTYDVTVTATDSYGISTSETFTVVVSSTQSDGSTVIMASNAASFGGLARNYAVLGSNGMTVPVSREPISREPIGPSGGSNPNLTPNVQSYWFTYDKDNRELVVDGKLSNGHIVADPNKATSFTQGYDAAGNIVSQYISYPVDGATYTQAVTKNYIITSSGHEEDTITNGGISESKVYDLDGRLLTDTTYYPPGSSASYEAEDSGEIMQGHYVTVSYAGWVESETTYSYNGDGLLTKQVTKGRSQNWTPQYLDSKQGDGVHYPDGSVVLSKNELDTTSTTTNTYDSAGRLSAYQTDGKKYNVIYEGGDTWLRSYTQDVTDPNSAFTANVAVYDTFNNLTEVIDESGDYTTPEAVRFFAVDASGNVIYKESGTQTANSLGYPTFTPYQNTDGSTDLTQDQHFYTVDGQVIGSADEAGDLQFQGNFTNFTTGQAGTYTVQSGDTLRSIAQQLYGNEQLWYVIADANGISDTDLRAGQLLHYPMHVTDTNDAGTFKPFDPSTAVGSTTPNPPYVPPANGQGCSDLAMVVMIVVTVVVSIYTAGAATSEMLELDGAAAGTAAAAATAVVGAGIGAAVGSAAGQEVGMQEGIVSHFSLSQALAAGVTSMASMGIGDVLGDAGQTVTNTATATVDGVSTTASASFTIGQTLTQSLEQSALTLAATEGINKAFGVATPFNWTSLAAETLGNAIGSQVGSAVSDGYKMDPNSLADMLTQAGGSTLGTVIADNLTGQKGTNYAQTFLDAFGNQLGTAMGQAAYATLNAQPDGNEALQSGDNLLNTGENWDGSSSASDQATVNAAASANATTAAAVAPQAVNNADGTYSMPDDPTIDAYVANEAQNQQDIATLTAGIQQNSAILTQDAQSLQQTQVLIGQEQAQTAAWFAKYDAAWTSQVAAQQALAAKTSNLTNVLSSIPGGFLFDPSFYDAAGEEVDNFTSAASTHFQNGVDNTEYDVGKFENGVLNAIGLGDQGAAGPANTAVAIANGAVAVANITPDQVIAAGKATVTPYVNLYNTQGPAATAGALVGDLGSQAPFMIAPELDVARGVDVASDILGMGADVSYNLIADNDFGPVNIAPLAKDHGYQYDQMFPGPLPDSAASNFFGGRYSEGTFDSETTLFKGGDAANLGGSWFSFQQPNSLANVYIDNAVRPQWIDPSTGVLNAESPVNSVISVTCPPGTKYYFGPPGTQGGIYLGGANNVQIYIPGATNTCVFKVVRPFP